MKTIVFSSHYREFVLPDDLFPFFRLPWLPLPLTSWLGRCRQGAVVRTFVLNKSDTKLLEKCLLASEELGALFAMGDDVTELAATCAQP